MFILSTQISNNQAENLKRILPMLNHFTGFNLHTTWQMILAFHNCAKADMYSFFYYTSMVNYGSKVDNAALFYSHTCVDNCLGQYNRAMFYGSFRANICSVVYNSRYYASSRFNFFYPLKPPIVVTKSGIYLNTGRNEIL